MLAIGDPGAGSRGVLAWRDTRRVTHDRDQIAFGANFQSQHAKAAVSVVERDSLGKARELFQRRQRRGGHGRVESMARPIPNRHPRTGTRKGRGV